MTFWLCEAVFSIFSVFVSHKIFSSPPKVAVIFFLKNFIENIKNTTRKIIARIERIFSKLFAVFQKVVIFPILKPIIAIKSGIGIQETSELTINFRNGISERPIYGNPIGGAYGMNLMRKIARSRFFSIRVSSLQRKFFAFFSLILEFLVKFLMP